MIYTVPSASFIKTIIILTLQNIASAFIYFLVGKDTAIRKPFSVYSHFKICCGDGIGVNGKQFTRNSLRKNWNSLCRVAKKGKRNFENSRCLPFLTSPFLTP